MTQRALKENVPFTSLSGARATVNEVFKILPGYSVVHFACHGHQDASEPFRTRFALYDEPLYLIDMVERGLPIAELAVLSACHSARGDRKSPDEVLHLAAAMNFAGFGSVVGTLWPVSDHDAPMLAQKFYHLMLGGKNGPADCTKAAVALSKSIGHLRRNGVPPWRWITWVHFGV